MASVLVELRRHRIRQQIRGGHGLDGGLARPLGRCDPSGIAIVLFATKMSLFTRPFITWEMLHFLHGDYKPCYWWDLVELGRKLMLTVVPLFMTLRFRCTMTSGSPLRW